MYIGPNAVSGGQNGHGKGWGSGALAPLTLGLGRAAHRASAQWSVPFLLNKY